MLSTNTDGARYSDQPIVCGVLSNAAINYGLVSGWIGKRSLLNRWGHITETADGPGSPIPKTTFFCPGSKTASSSSHSPTSPRSAPGSPKLSSSSGSNDRGSSGSLCAQVIQQMEQMCSELCRLQQDVEHSVYIKALTDRHQKALLYVELWG